jgi:hypothetical protein
MTSESFSLPEDWVEDEYTEADKLRFTHREIRHAAKDISLLVQNFPADYPNRDKVVQLAREVLDLMPVYNAADEAYEESQREQYEESRKLHARAFQEWKRRHS